MINYKFSAGGEQPVDLKFNFKAFGKVAIEYNGQDVPNTVNARKLLGEPETVVLPDGKKMELQMKPGFLKNDLIVVIDGNQIGGKTGLEKNKNNSKAFAESAMLYISVINLLVGVLGLFVEYLRELGFGFINLTAGIIYLTLWYFATKKSSRVAYFIFLGLFLIDTVFTIAVVVSNGSFNFGLVIRAIFLYQLFAGIKNYRKEENKLDTSIAQ